MKKKTIPTKNKKNQEDTYILLGTAGVGIALFLAMRNKATAASIINTSPVTNITNNTARFPIMLGANSQEVKNIQQALLKLGGTVAAYINGSGGADGKYGTGTENALKAAGLPTVITEADYNRIVYGSTGSSQVQAQPSASSNEAVQSGLKLIYTGSLPTTIWKEASQNWIGVVNGEKAITTIAPKTFLGMDTGIKLKDFVKVRNNIGNRDYYFWVKDFYITTYNDLSLATSQGGKLKSESEKAAIVNA